MTESRRDILISTVLDEPDAPAWNELAMLADSEPTLWRDVAEALRDHARLGRLMEAASTVADRVPITSRPRAARHRSSARRWSFDGWSRWAGWAVAAVVVLAWAVGLPSPAKRRPGAAAPMAVLPVSGTVPGAMAGAEVIPVGTARDAFDAYLQRGRAEGLVLSDEPRRVLLETRRDPSGEGYELIYLQQIMEKTVVPNLFRVTGQDERGRPSLVRYEGPAGDPM